MKTWEKIYWGIIGTLFVLSLSPLLGSEELLKVTVNGEDRLFSKFQYFYYDLVGFVIIFAPFWLIVRLIVNKGWSDKSKERERERDKISI